MRTLEQSLVRRSRFGGGDAKGRGTGEITGTPPGSGDDYPVLNFPGYLSVASMRRVLFLQHLSTGFFLFFLLAYTSKDELKSVIA